jgi:putative pyrimidine permease RutG
VGAHLTSFAANAAKGEASSEGEVLPEERLPAAQMVVVGLQHVVAMFGATVLAPLLTGFDPNVAVLFSGIGTLIFFVAVGGQVPSYLGSSFSFIAVIIAATGYSGHGPNANLSLALGGIIAAGALYAAIGLAVAIAGNRWVERLMPPVVTGAVVAVIGLNLAPIAVKSASGATLESAIALLTVVAVGATAVFAPRAWRRVSILVGGGGAYAGYCILANAFGVGEPIDFSRVAAADWLGLPNFSLPVFNGGAVALIAPVAVILVAENLGHVKAVSVMTGRNLDPYLGRAFIGDGVATMIAGCGGGTGVTTYAENIGVMAVTKIYSSRVFVIAALFAILLGFSPKFGAVILSIPRPVIGGLSILLFGLIAATAARIWVENKVDFSRPGNLVTVGTSLVLGAGNLAVDLGGFTLGGIGTATFGAIILNQLLGPRAGEAARTRAGSAWATHAQLARATQLTTMEEAAASIGHEIKQPLTAIIMHGNAGARWLANVPPGIEEAMAALKHIVADGHRATQVIDSMRAMFRKDGGERAELLDINDVVRDVIALLRDELDGAGVTVRLDLVDGLPQVLIDRIQLQQVVLNLLNNAVEAMSGVRDRPRVLDVRTSFDAPDHVVMAISDSGSGIDPKNVRHIFDPFFTTKLRGMGMGLSICRSIVETHGGRLWVSPGTPHGSVFHVRLPTAAADADVRG